jgi:hypothetical protein
MTSTNWNGINNALSRAILDGDRLNDLLDDLGCDTRGHRWGAYRLPCPVHDGDGPNMTILTHGYDLPIRWACHSHHCHDTFKPSLLGLVRGALTAQRGEPVSMRESVDYLKRFAGDVAATHEKMSPRPQAGPTLLDLTREQVRERLEIPSPYFLSRGFSRDVLDSFDVGHSAKLNREVVPLYDELGTTCIGYVARTNKPFCTGCDGHHEPGAHRLFGEPKWKAMQGFPRATYLYNYAAANAADSPFIFLVEGPPDVLRLAEAGFVGVALLGCDASPQQLAKLAALGKEIWVSFDNDEAGRAAEQRFWKKMDSCGIRFPARPFSPGTNGKDLGDTGIEEIRTAVGRAA